MVKEAFGKHIKVPAHNIVLAMSYLDREPPSDIMGHQKFKLKKELKVCNP